MILGPDRLVTRMSAWASLALPRWGLGLYQEVRYLPTVSLKGARRSQWNKAGRARWKR